MFIACIASWRWGTFIIYEKAIYLCRLMTVVILPLLVLSDSLLLSLFSRASYFDVIWFGRPKDGLWRLWFCCYNMHRGHSTWLIFSYSDPKITYNGPSCFPLNRDEGITNAATPISAPMAGREPTGMEPRRVDEFKQGTQTWFQNFSLDIYISDTNLVYRRENVIALF